jgi:hypothetical protein
MKQAYLAVVASALFSLATSANAALVTWNFQGQLNSVDGYTEYKAGDMFEVRLNFDTSAAVVNNLPRRFELDPSSLSMNLKIGNTGWQQLDYAPTTGGLFFLRDNHPNPDSSSAGPVDGLTFSLNSSKYTNGVALIMRWNDLNVINGGQVPSIPPALLNMSTNAFQGGDANGNFFAGTINSVNAIPEPETYAMLGLGLIGVAAVARRRQQKKS